MPSQPVQLYQGEHVMLHHGKQTHATPSQPVQLYQGEHVMLHHGKQTHATAAREHEHVTNTSKAYPAIPRVDIGWVAT